MLEQKTREAIAASVLCWLATVDQEGQPSVSPKEVFTVEDSGRILIAHIASPQTARNLRQNAAVCAAFLNILTQKGVQVYGQAKLIERDTPAYTAAEAVLGPLVGPRFKLLGIIALTPERTREIVAPSYRFFPETTEAEKVAESLQTYGFPSLPPS